MCNHDGVHNITIVLADDAEAIVMGFADLQGVERQGRIRNVEMNSNTISFCLDSCRDESRLPSFFP